MSLLFVSCEDDAAIARDLLRDIPPLVVHNIVTDPRGIPYNFLSSAVGLHNFDQITERQGTIVQMPFESPREPFITKLRENFYFENQLPRHYRRVIVTLNVGIDVAVQVLVGTIKKEDNYDIPAVLLIDLDSGQRDLRGLDLIESLARYLFPNEDNHLELLLSNENILIILASREYTHVATENSYIKYFQKINSFCPKILKAGICEDQDTMRISNGKEPTQADFVVQRRDPTSVDPNNPSHYLIVWRKDSPREPVADLITKFLQDWVDQNRGQQRLAPVTPPA